MVTIKTTEEIINEDRNLTHQWINNKKTIIDCVNNSDKKWALVEEQKKEYNNIMNDFFEYHQLQNGNLINAEKFEILNDNLKKLFGDEK